MIVMTIYKSTTASMAHANASNQYKKIDNYTIKPVNATNSRLVHHYHDPTFSKRSSIHNHQDPLLHRLIVERDNAKKTLNNNTNDLAIKVIKVIKHYNSLIEVLVKIEAKEGYQVDQSLQHFLVFHRRAFSFFGIAIRQFLYLEYDPIVLRGQIANEGVQKSNILLLGSKGIITELFYLFDRVVSSLESPKDFEMNGHLLDIKA